MAQTKFLIVGGTWDLDGGKPSGFVSKMCNAIRKYRHDDAILMYNGGDYNKLKDIINLADMYDTVFWLANVDNSLPKICNVKEINPKAMLISSKNNLGGKYTFQDILQRSFKSKSNLMIEFTNGENNKFKMRVFDPLGILYYNGENIDEMTLKILTRLDIISKITKQSTTSDEENSGALAWFFNQFKQEMHHENENPIPSKNAEFLEVVKNYASIFAGAMAHNDKILIERFLGNASLRCPKGFPSFRDKDYIFVSRRNVNKAFIGPEDFVPVRLKDNKLFYCGNYKPSVDTPIQVRLYEMFPNINYMIHGHVYVNDAPYTQNPLPCGAVEEVDEIANIIAKRFDNDFNKDFYAINLIGHGCILMADTPDKLTANLNFTARPQPEVIAGVS